MFALLLACTSSISSPDATWGDDTQTSQTDDTSAADDTDPGDSDTDTGVPGTAQDYWQTGPKSVTTSQTTISASCEMAVTLYVPDGGGPRVILNHGFARAPANMVGVAQHLASWGFEVATPALCHLSLAGSDHPQNAADLVTLNSALGGGSVWVAGHSAGGLAAFLAAAQDANIKGVVLLDPTDGEGLGAAAASSIQKPVYGLLGESNTCNESNNFAPVLASTAGAKVLTVVGSDHCDFEDPTDWVCETFCSPQGASDSVQVKADVWALLTAALAQEAGLDPAAGAAWWDTGGSYREQLGSRVQ